MVKIAELLATLWGVPLEEVAEQTTANFESAFAVTLPRITSSMPDLSVVFPVYNEEENIPILLDEIAKALDGKAWTYEIVAVDDGSTRPQPGSAAREPREVSDAARAHVREEQRPDRGARRGVARGARDVRRLARRRSAERSGRHPAR